MTESDVALKRKPQNLRIYHTLWSTWKCTRFIKRIYTRDAISLREYKAYKLGHSRKSAEARFTDYNSSLSRARDAQYYGDALSSAAFMKIYLFGTLLYSESLLADTYSNISALKGLLSLFFYNVNYADIINITRKHVLC